VTAAPAAVVDLAVAGRDSTAVLLTWTAPRVYLAPRDFRPADRYDVRFTDADSATWASMTPLDSLPHPREPGAAESLWVSGLRPVTLYSFQLAAAGAGAAWSRPSNRAMGATLSSDRVPPGEISLRFVRATPRSITVTFSAPGDDGERGTAAVYQGQFRHEDDQEWRSFSGLPAPHPGGTPEEIDLTGLEEGRFYRLRLWAVDEAGNAGGAVEFLASTAVAEDAGWSDEFTAPPGGSGTNGTVYALAVYQDELFAGGSFTRAGQIEARGIAAWNGVGWRSVGRILGGLSPEIHFLAVLDGKLYAAGSFDRVDGVNTGAVAVWDGSTWSAIGPGIDGDVRDVCLHGGAVYVCGILRLRPGSSPIYLAKWDGDRWTGVAFPASSGRMRLAEYQGALYASTDEPLRQDNDECYVLRRDGENWLPTFWAPAVGWLPEYCCTGVQDLQVIGGGLVAAGYAIGEWGNLARTDGQDWEALDPPALPLDEAHSVIHAVRSWQGRLVVGGWFHSRKEPQSCDVSVQEGGCWRLLGSGVGQCPNDFDPWPSGTVHAVAEYQGDLYVAGRFELAGLKPAANISRWGE
jgi:hypothetical protein